MKKKKLNVIPLILGAGVILALVVILICVALPTKPVEAGSEEPEKSTVAQFETAPPVYFNPAAASAPEEDLVPWDWVFYNHDVQDDADNSYNFGPSAETDDPKAADAELRARVQQDPALGAAVMAWLDNKLKTRHLGEFCYPESDQEWSDIINSVKEELMYDEAEYRIRTGAFFRQLDRAEVSIETAAKLKDWMYQNPETKDGVPDVIVYKTEENNKKVLVYTFKLKNKTPIKVAYRLDCGFQPTEPTGSTVVIKKKDDDDKGGGGGGSAAASTSDSTSSSQDKKNPPGKKYEKDPSEGTKVFPNDDSEGGSNTNNPDNPDYSTDDKSSNTNHQKPKETEEAIQEIKDANTPQAGGSGQPSTPPPTLETPVDSNPGEVEKPTPVNEPPVGGVTPGEAWDGPPA